jgi:hypothetical protein
MADTDGNSGAQSSTNWQDRLKTELQPTADALKRGDDAPVGDDEDEPEKKKKGVADDLDDHSNDDDGNDDDSDDDSDDDQDNDADDDAANDDDEEEDKSDVKLSQFKGDGKRGSYTKNIENGYIELAQEHDETKERADLAERQVTAIRQAAAKDPEFGQKLVALLDVDGSGGSGTGDGSGSGSGSADDAEDPFLVHAKTEWKAANDKSTSDFVKDNPEVITDPKLNKEVKRLMKRFSDAELKDNGRLMMGGEAMEKAFAYLGRDIKKKADQELKDGMKGNAAPTRPKRPVKPSNKGTKQFSDLTLTLASKMGRSKDYLKKYTQKS